MPESADDSPAFPSGRLSGRRIVVTGAASGIGNCTARLFSAEGAAVTLLDRNIAGLEDIASEIQGHAFAADVTDEQSVARAIESGAKAMGGIDGVVNAAGVMLRGSVLDVPKAFSRCLATLFKPSCSSIARLRPGRSSTRSSGRPRSSSSLASRQQR